jgi:hypothetical protein
VIGQDPLLTDPENGDYSLQPGSPAAGYGCITFPEKIDPAAMYSREPYIYKHQLLTDRTIEVEGEISENTYWEADTVIVIGDLTINNDVFLEIAPGTIVEFAGFFKISVSGAIIAEGNSDSRILFKSTDPHLYEPDTTTAGSWNGIKFINTNATNQTSRFTYCVFENSKSLTEDITGGVISCYNFSQLIVTNCIFRNNLAIFGSVFGCDYNSAPTLTNNLFYDNAAVLAGSPFYVKYSHPVINYNTITANTIQNEDEWYVTGIIHTYIAKPQLTGNIIRDNFTNYYFGDQILEGKAFYVNFNNIENWTGGTGNLDQPAQFVLQGDQPYYLDQFSPCINAGTNELPWNFPLPQTDLAGEIRVYDDFIDMGAYEWQGTSSEEDIISITNLKLKNYPNPFNPSTTIFFISNTEVTEKIELTIYNIKGQMIRTFTNPIILSGVEGTGISKNQSERIKYNFYWNGKDNSNLPVSSGLYFCKLKSGNQTASRKMILLK